MADKKYEIITAVKTEDLLHPTNYLYQGYRADSDLCRQLVRDLRTKIEPVNWQRFRLEDNAAFQQPIPYVLVAKDNKLLAYVRRDPGDTRLLDNVSVGFGGHVNLDADGSDVLKAARRELGEELKFKGTRLTDKIFKERVEPLGVLKDWTNPVGAVHVGLIMWFDATGLEVEAREKGIEIFWDAATSIYGGPHKLENWSIDILTKYMEKTPPWITTTKAKKSQKQTGSKTQPSSKSRRKRQPKK